MPIPAPVLTAGIQAGGNLLSQGINAVTTSATNKAARKFAVERYDVERKDALSDWAMQNEYNSPQAQMQRLKAAGLNPNMVYGHGAEGNASGTIRSHATGSWNPEAPKVDFSGVTGALASIYDFKIKQATYDNLTAQNSVILNDSLLKAVQAEQIQASTNTQRFDLDLKRDLRQNSLTAADLALKKTQKDIDSMTTNIYTSLNEDERRTMKNATDIQKTMEDILKSRADRSKTEAEKKMIYQQIENLKKDGTLKQLEINMRKMGINPSDPTWQRVLAQLMSGKSFVTDLPVFRGGDSAGSAAGGVGKFKPKR